MTTTENMALLWFSVKNGTWTPRQPDLQRWVGLPEDELQTLLSSLAARGLIVRDAGKYPCYYGLR